MFPATAALAWAVLAYISIDFGFLNKVIEISPGSEQVWIERQQPRCGQILPRLHVVDPADHQVLGAGVDIKQRGLRGDFAQAA